MWGLLWCSQAKLDEDLTKQADYCDSPREEYLDSMLEDLTPQDLRVMMQSEDELTQTKVTDLSDFQE